MEIVGEGKKVLLGNEAITRGALEADVDVATTYPGTPSSEIADSFSAVARFWKNEGKDVPFYFQYSVNEKVALEVAAAASHTGLRALTCMKHVGVNVASDTLMTYAYIGSKGGHVIVSADDPSCHSSQNEQDNRLFAKFASLPLLEPSSAQEAKDMTIRAFELSERLSLPVLLRTTTRISHMRGVVDLLPLNMKKKKGNFEKGRPTVTVPNVARKLHPALLEKMARAQDVSNESEFNYREGEGTIGIITSGAAYNYVRESLDDLELTCNVFKIGMSYPLPDKMIIDFLNTCDKVLVVEELEPFLEEQVKVIARDNDISIPIFGKDFGGLKRYFEYDIDIVETAISELFEVTLPESLSETDDVASRPPVLCPGCPHRATYYAVKQVTPDDTVYPTDIGCYTLGLLPPYKTADFLLCMGSSIGTACGFAETTDQQVIAFLGDSTFYHSGIPPLANAVHHNHNFVVIILDNSTTAMTGHQPHPGTLKDGMGNDAVPLDLEQTVRGFGVKHIEIINPRNLKEAKQGIKRALDFKGLSVVISKAPCILLKKKTASHTIYTINQEKCKKCKICITKYACPAMFFDNDDIRINSSLCAGCGVCYQVCPYDAIEVKQ